MSGNLRVLLGVAPFAGVIGFLTPMLVDRWSGGDPDRAGRAYAVNVVGCILGPLLAGFLLLAVVRRAGIDAAAGAAMVCLANPAGDAETASATAAAMAGGFLVAALVLFFLTEDYETIIRNA